MTVIAWDGRMMAADRGEFNEGIKGTSLMPKIVRSSEGYLVGVSGDAAMAHAAREWWSSRVHQRSPLRVADGACVAELVVKPDRTIWARWNFGTMLPVGAPHVIGETDAGAYVLGAMHAGVSAAAAVSLAVDHCTWVAGPVQVEYLAQDIEAP